MRGNRGLAAALLIAIGALTLLAADPVAHFFAQAAIPDLVRKIVGALLIGNGLLMVMPRLAFVASIVPMLLTTAALVLFVRAGVFVSVPGTLAFAGGVAFLLILGRIAWRRRPRGLPRTTTTPGMEKIFPRHV